MTPRLFKRFYSPKQLALAASSCDKLELKHYLHEEVPGIRYAQVLRMSDEITALFPEWHGYTPSDNSVYNVYGGNTSYPLQYHVDVANLIVMINMNLPSRLDFVHRPADVVPSELTDRYYATPLPRTHYPPDLTLEMEPRDAVIVTREDELDGWMHGGIMQPGRKSLILRYERDGHS